MYHQKHFFFRRNRSDEGRQSRFFRRSSQDHQVSPSLSPAPSEDFNGGRRGSSVSIKAPASQDLPKERAIEAGPLGLNVIFTPKDSPKVDIVFVHGLGGSSHKTWSRNGDPELFWPLKFLPLEPYISLSRIFTFGYNANFRVAGNVSTSVLDFAKDLLFDLKFAKDDLQRDLNIGRVSKCSTEAL